MSKTYTLASAGFVFAPGFIKWAINGASFPKDRAKMIEVVSRGWDIPTDAATALLLKKVPFTVVQDDCVQFTVPSNH